MRGRIKSDDLHDEQLPLLVIDGQKIDWNKFGRLLMGHEGTQFRLTIAGNGEELSACFGRAVQDPSGK